jgi:putative copper resistance protein D
LFFSLHMLGHMALSMVVPPLLVFGAPVTLLLRALPVRRDGSRGPREWLLAVMESRYVKVITHPVFAGVMFTGSLVAFYYSSLFGLALRTHAGHELMMVHFLLAGYLFTFAVIGVDPAPVRLGYAFRLLLLFITMAFHAFFAVGLMSQETLLQGSYFSSLGWGIDALADQKNGGAIAWGVGDGPTLLLAVVLALQWARSDERLARRRDRAADRDGDAELRKYNEMLAELARRDRSLQQ